MPQVDFLIGAYGPVVFFGDIFPGAFDLEPLTSYSIESLFIQ